MISDVINSSVLIYDIKDRYNVLSNDFVTRIPDWIVSAMREIGIRNALETKIYKSAFANNRILLPSFCETVDMVLIDDRKVDYADSLYVIDTEIDLNRKLKFTGDPTHHNFNNELVSASGSGNIDPEFANGQNKMFYKVERGWLHTNVRYGTIEIKYKKLTTTLDEMLGIEFPIIPDGHHTKEAIMWFILKTMLMRGYVHPVLNLKENNPIINPGLAYKQEVVQARIELNSPNRDAREKWAYPQASLFGKRRPIWIKQETAEEALTPPNERWVTDGPAYCEVIGGFNTGYQFVPMKKQVYTFDTWTDTLEVRVDKVLNVEACPLSLTRAGYCVHGSTYTSPTYITFTEGVNMGIEIPAQEAYGYLFVAIPATKEFAVIDDASANITNQFELVGTEVVEGYVTCDVYRSTNQFYLGLGFEFILVIE